MPAHSYGHGLWLSVYNRVIGRPLINVDSKQPGPKDGMFKKIAGHACITLGAATGLHCMDLPPNHAVCSVTHIHRHIISEHHCSVL